MVFFASVFIKVLFKCLNHELTLKVELKLRIEAYFCTLFRVQQTRYGRYIHSIDFFFNKQHRQRARSIYPIGL